MSRAVQADMTIGTFATHRVHRLHTKPGAGATAFMGYALLLWSALGCGQVGSSPDARRSPADTSVAGPQMCDPFAKFGAPVPIAELATVNAGAPRLSSDELTIYFHAYGDQVDLWSTHRPSLTEPFGPPTSLAGQNSPSADFDPAV